MRLVIMFCFRAAFALPALPRQFRQLGDEPRNPIANCVGITIRALAQIADKTVLALLPNGSKNVSSNGRGRLIPRWRLGVPVYPFRRHAITSTRLGELGRLQQ